MNLFPLPENIQTKGIMSLKKYVPTLSVNFDCLSHPLEIPNIL